MANKLVKQGARNLDFEEHRSRRHAATELRDLCVRFPSKHDTFLKRGLKPWCWTIIDPGSEANLAMLLTGLFGPKLSEVHKLTTSRFGSRASAKTRPTLAELARMWAKLGQCRPKSVGVGRAFDDACPYRPKFDHRPTLVKARQMLAKMRSSANVGQRWPNLGRC